MENKKIGIKIADGSFYPILEEGSLKKKRLVLTTVNDNQDSVQIDLYRGSGETLEGATYIGSLLVDEIKQGVKGDAEIELTMGVDEEGNLNSVATDRASGLKQSFSVGLKNLGEEGQYEVPDFTFTEEEPAFDEEELSFDAELQGDEDVFGEEPLEEAVPEDAETGAEEDFDFSGFDDVEEASGEPEFGEEFPEVPKGIEPEQERKEEAFPGGDELGEETPEEDQQEDRKAKPLLVGLLVVIALALIGALLYLFVFMAGDEKGAPPLEAQNGAGQEQVVSAPEVKQEGESATGGVPEGGSAGSLEEGDEGAEKTAASETSRTEGPVVSGSGLPSKERVEFTGGVWYKIRWGDTLWQISSSFYDNPKLYEKIADENEIPNPDRIFAEDSIFIPRQ